MNSARTGLVALTLCLAAVFPATAQDSAFVHCHVFHDQNGDGLEQVGEPPLAGVLFTNGVLLAASDSAGNVGLWVDRNNYRFATMTVPRGFWPTTSWFHWMPVGTAGPDSATFGLATSTASASDTLTFVHVADTQTKTWGDSDRFDEDLLQINELPDPPLFVINAGDLVETGSDTTHWNNYMSQIAVSNHPVLPVVGNHEIIGTTPPLVNYEFYVGPPYYSFEAGNWHFVVYNVENAPAGTPLQDTWLVQDLAAATPGTHRAVFQHRQLSDMPESKVATWETLGITANFSGHWHSLQFTRRSNGMRDFNLSRTRSGPLDQTPRVFGIVTCTEDGDIAYELRRLAVDHRSAITSPQSAQVVGQDFLEVMVQAYDTSSLVTALSASVSGAGGSIPATALTREGISLWRATLDASSLPDGTYSVTVTGGFDDGQPINLSQVFGLSSAVPVVRAPTTDWPMFRKCAEGSSFVSTKLEPPLELAWCTPVPGLVGMSSPVVADGKVYLGCRAERDIEEAGVLAVDAVTGAVDWFTHFPAGVALSPAVVGGRVVATAISDSAYALDAVTGARVWAVSIPNARYNMAGVIAEGPVAWLASEPWTRQVQISSGFVDWVTPYIGDDWFPDVYSVPAVDSDNLYFGVHNWPMAGHSGFTIISRIDGTLSYTEPGIFRSPIVAGDTVYVVGDADRTAQQLTARDTNGAVLWTASKLVGVGTGSPALGNGIIVQTTTVNDVTNTVDGFRASDGTNLWTFPVGPELFDMISGLRSAPGCVATAAITDSVVYQPALDGNLYALDLATGAELWRWSFGVPVASSPAVSGNMLFVGASDGHLYAFNSLSPMVGTGAPELPGRASVFTFYAPRPNPSGSRTRIEWTMPERARVRVRIFDVGGRVVRTLADGVRDGGDQRIVWDGTDGRGATVASGVYFARVEAGEHTAVRRFVRLR